jgi:hypothetical protein
MRIINTAHKYAQQNIRRLHTCRHELHQRHYGSRCLDSCTLLDISVNGREHRGYAC